MDFAERADARLEPIPLERCRELLGEEAETLTDEEIALVDVGAGHAAWIGALVAKLRPDGTELD